MEKAPTPSPCMICGHAESVLHTRKHVGRLGLGEVEYRRCTGCDFVFSQTHAEMTDAEWGELNRAFHAAYQSTEENADDPRWLARIEAQAAVIDDCAALGLIPSRQPWLDFAAGGGQLSTALSRLGPRQLLNYDRYMATPEPKPAGKPAPGQFDFVVSTSTFEHIRTRADLDAIHALVSAEGVQGMHTLVSEAVPTDPAWFYYLPVHCSFFSNRSLELLLRQWGYQSSLYEVNSRLWLFFKRPVEEIQPIIEKAKGRAGHPAYFVKAGFMDYWQ